jgi:peptidyl-tRNA hydrolase, PTH2 family
MDTKQVIVIRKDLNMRKGKMVAQGSHASMAFLTKNGGIQNLQGSHDPCDHNPYSFFESAKIKNRENSKEINDWLKNSFRKIVCSVNSEQELEELHARALEKCLISHLVIDNGATEFNNVPTKTCLAIGPHEESKFFGLTDHLPLL